MGAVDGVGQLVPLGCVERVGIDVGRGFFGLGEELAGLGGGLPEAKEEPADQAEVNQGDAGGGEGDGLAALGGAAGGAHIGRQEFAERCRQGRQRTRLDRRRQPERLGEGFGIRAFERGPNFHADRVGIESLHRKLGQREADFAGKRGIGQSGIDRGCLKISKIAMVVEREDPAAKFFPNRKRVALDMKRARRNVEAVGRARRKLFVAWRFEKHR